MGQHPGGRTLYLWYIAVSAGQVLHGIVCVEMFHRKSAVSKFALDPT